MNNIRSVTFSLAIAILSAIACSQQNGTHNLSHLLKENKLIINPGYSARQIADGSKQGITSNGITWLKDVSFKKGTIEVDLRGRDVFQQSFIGISFHCVDTTVYDVIYFRPFNFQSDDTLRRQHTVQYVSEPDYPWQKLRAEHPLVYENAINPFPLATDWFHARIVVGDADITVYVNHSPKPSLKVKKLNNRKDGLIGLWTTGLEGDFANLVIKQ